MKDSCNEILILNQVLGALIKKNNDFLHETEVSLCTNEQHFA
jgi:hypothetical protein